jgi:two-component system cell cycle response regulator CpdR
MRPLASTRVEHGGAARPLLAEDQPDVRLLLERGLLRAGFEVTAVADGDEALRVLETEQPFDALCTDAIMPGALASDVIATFARRFPGRRIVLMSGYLLDELHLGLPNTVVILHKPLTHATFAAALGG